MKLRGDRLEKNRESKHKDRRPAKAHPQGCGEDDPPAIKHFLLIVVQNLVPRGRSVVSDWRRYRPSSSSQGGFLVRGISATAQRITCGGRESTRVTLISELNPEPQAFAQPLELLSFRPKTVVKPCCAARLTNRSAAVPATIPAAA